MLHLDEEVVSSSIALTFSSVRGVVVFVFNYYY